MQFKVDHYEDARPDKRDRFQLVIPGEVREEMIKDSGHSRKEIQKAVRQVNLTRQRRWNTKNSQSERLDELMESARRKIKRLVTKKSKKQQELETWSKSQSCTIKCSCSELALTDLVETTKEALDKHRNMSCISLLDLNSKFQTYDGSFDEDEKMLVTSFSAINRNYSIPDMTAIKDRAALGDSVSIQAAKNCKSSDEELDVQNISRLNGNFFIPRIQSSGCNDNVASFDDFDSRQETSEEVVDTNESGVNDDDWYF